MLIRNDRSLFGGRASSRLHAQASIEPSCGTAAGRLGQASTEFLAFMAIGIVILTITLVIYSTYSSAAKSTQLALEADAECVQIASFFSSFAMMGEGSTAAFSLPRSYDGAKYDVWVIGNQSLIKVDYELSGERMGVGCHYPAMNVTNATDGGTGEGKVFALNRNFVLHNNGKGVIWVGP
jgi:hypothetical protein